MMDAIMKQTTVSKNIFIKDPKEDELTNPIRSVDMKSHKLKLIGSCSIGAITMAIRK